MVSTWSPVGLKLVLVDLGLKLLCNRIFNVLLSLEFLVKKLKIKFEKGLTIISQFGQLFVHKNESRVPIQV